MECNICMETFNASERRPKCIVPCGHTVCLHCLKRIGSQTCPECRRAFAGPLKSLPDNYFLLGLLEKGHLSRSDTRLWCRQCSKVPSEECADLGHVLCSLRKLRTEQVEPKLQQLESAVASALKVVQALEEAKGSVEAQLTDWRARLHQAMEAQNELRAAANAGRDVSASLPQGLEQCQQAASLLQANCQMQIQLQDGHGTAWNGNPQGRDGGSLLSPLLLHLHQHGAFAQVLRVKPDAVAEQLAFSLDECLDVSSFTTSEDHGRELEQILQDPNLDKVRQLTNMSCNTWPNWCKLLLMRVAPSVEWLDASHPQHFHLDVIGRMLSLRYLRVHLKDSNTVAPDLPLQLEDLEVKNVPNQYLLSIQRMPNLRRLILEWKEEPFDVQCPPLPPGHRGLQWLCVRLKPASTVLSLVKAHAATLQELRILTASEGKLTWHCKDLANRLRQFKLPALRRVVLLREYAPNTPVYHSEGSCQRQKCAVWDGLLAMDAQRAVRVVEVLCEVCDECPAFPAMGDVAWKVES